MTKRSKSLVAKSTTAVFKTLLKGEPMSRKQIGRLAYRTNHRTGPMPESSKDYYHGALEQHVERGRVRKTNTKRNGVTYRITRSGRQFAELKQIA